MTVRSFAAEADSCYNDLPFHLRYLRSVSILTFMNKIDILKEKIERGANFAEALEKIKAEALFNASSQSGHSDHDRQIYRRLHEILCENPYETFPVTGRRKFRIIQ